MIDSCTKSSLSALHMAFLPSLLSSSSSSSPMIYIHYNSILLHLPRNSSYTPFLLSILYSVFLAPTISAVDILLSIFLLSYLISFSSPVFHRSVHSGSRIIIIPIQHDRSYIPHHYSHGYFSQSHPHTIL